MARCVLPFAAFAAACLLLAGCSNYEQARRPAWRTQAENACIAQRLIQTSAHVQPVQEIAGPGICGLTRPFRVTALLDGEVGFNSTYTLDCPMIAALNTWVREVVEPTAQARFGQRVVELIVASTYSCRGVNNQPGARLSEHSFGNAIDIAGFRLADGREISIVRDWTRGDEQAQAFLRDLHGGACQDFTTVLGPGFDMFHYNHFHLDLAMHGNTSSGPRRICRPAPSQQIPSQPRDNLPEAPSIEDDLDVAQAGTPPGSQALALHSGPGSVEAALPPPRPPLQAARAYVQWPQPQRGSIRDDGAFVPEGNPKDWDLTSSMGRGE
jgi:Extensin-like protein C-terminus